MLYEKFKQSYYQLLKLLRQDAKLLSRIRRENLVVVLNLHQVTPQTNPFWSPMNPEIFDDLLNFLKQNFLVTSFRELEKAQTDKPLAVISFDDGYYNFIEYALPILEKHNLSANMNIIPSCVESGEPMWNVILYDFLNSAPKSLIDEIRLPGFNVRMKDESFRSKARYGLQISLFLKTRPRQEREELLREIEKPMRKLDFNLTRMMNREEIKEIAKTHEIGVHSFSHESMKFESDAFFEEDLQKCLAYFEKDIGLPLDIYAFPNGSYRPSQIEILQRHDVKYKLLVDERYARKDETVLPRFTIYGATSLETRFQALGFNSKEN